MSLLPHHSGRVSARSQHTKGQADHTDAWLMSYADMITLLFMFFVIMVSAAAGQEKNHPKRNDSHPLVPLHHGLLALGTPYDETYRSLIGTVTSNHADQDIAAQRSERGLTIELSAVRFFAAGSADIPKDQMPLLRSIAGAIEFGAHDGDTLEVESYTDDGRPLRSRFANNWELSAMRAARIANLLIDQGVDPARLRAVSYAENRPAVPNIDAAGVPIAENRRHNQRIVIRLERAP